MKPLGYYTQHTPGDGGVIDTIENMCGTYLQELSSVEKAVVLSKLAQEIDNYFIRLFESGQVNQVYRPNAVRDITALCSGLGVSDMFGVMQVLIDQLKSNNN